MEGLIAVAGRLLRGHSGIPAAERARAKCEENGKRPNSLHHMHPEGLQFHKYKVYFLLMS
jgi:hypothetical protein